MTRSERLLIEATALLHAFAPRDHFVRAWLRETRAYVVWTHRQPGPVACEVCGHQALLDHLRHKLDVEPHETTEDGRITLLALECLGSCDTAPVALVDDTLHENLTLEKLDEILDRLPD